MRMKVAVAHRKIYKFLLVFSDKEAESKKIGNLFHKKTELRIRIRDPVPFRPLDPDSGMGKKSGSGSGMSNQDHISASLETGFWG
jgi:hypothetical protein